jgi:hypothetical protein
VVGDLTAPAIGGEYDRQVLTGYGAVHRWISRKKEQAIDYRAGVDIPATVMTTWETYRREMIGYVTSERVLIERHFWVHESLTRDDAVIKIIDGYPLP